jgi:hypothetical protein
MLAACGTTTKRVSSGGSKAHYSAHDPVVKHRVEQAIITPSIV